MERTIIIEPINKAIKQQTLPLGFWYKGIYKTLTPDFVIQDWRGNASDTKNVPMTGIWKFSHIKTQEIIKYEDDPNKAKEIDKRKKLAIETFFGLHSLVLYGETEESPKWNSNAKDHQFKIVDATEKGLEEITNFEDRLNVMNKVYSMDFAEKRGVCFYFGQNPVGKTEKELNIFLTDPQTGYLFTSGLDEQFKNKVETFKKVFMSEDPERNFNINIQKAIMLGVIENRPDNGKNNYYLGATPIGQTSTDVIMYFKKEPDLYQNHIISQVKEKDDVKAEVKKSIVQLNNITAPPVANNDLQEKEELKLRAKQLKTEGYIPLDFKWHVVGVEKLRQEVAAAEERKAAAFEVEKTE